MTRHLALLMAAVCCAATGAVATENTTGQPAHRKRVGVAFSGGGALGLAHIGVLRYFEEHHIPVDLIAGTSMGGLVGGLYASGMDAAELQELALNADWDQLLNPTVRFRDQPIAEKQRWHRAYGDLTLRFGKRLSLPQGVNSGGALLLLLSRNLAGYGGDADFADLPTPFRCVATDLLNADAVVLDHGSLTKAMRATMAIPAVFTPVPWDGKLLVDGGLVMNLPVEVARDMGADDVIAIALDTGTPKAAQFNTLTSILSRSVSVVVIQNERRSAAQADLVVTVDTSRFTGIDYAKSAELISVGYETARTMAAKLAKYELNDEAWNAYRAGRAARRHRAPAAGRVVTVEAPQPSFQQNARTEIARKTGDAVVSTAKLEDTLTGIVAATGVPGAAYQWDTERQGYKVAFLPKTGEGVLLKPSFSYGASSGEPSRAALRLSWSAYTADSYKSRWMLSQTIGADPQMRGEYYHPSGGSGHFAAPGFFAERQRFYRYEGSSHPAETRDRFGASFYGGWGTWRFVQLRLGARAGYDSYSKNIVTDRLPSPNHSFVSPEATWSYNTQDSAALASRGTRIEGSAGYSIRDRSYPYLQNRFITTRPATRSISLFAENSMATSFGHQLNYYDQFMAGGLGQLGAYRYQEFHTNSYVSNSEGVTFHPPFVRKLYFYPGLTLWHEIGRLDLGAQGWRTVQSTAAGVFFRTPIGVAGVGVFFNEKGKARFRISLGSVERY